MIFKKCKFRCVVLTTDKRCFYYNATSHTSHWKKPAELQNQPEVDKLTKELRDQAKNATTFDSEPSPKKQKADCSGNESIFHFLKRTFPKKTNTSINLDLLYEIKRLKLI